jgi:hypothetical protein
MLGTILIVLLLLALIGGLPVWGIEGGWLAWSPGAIVIVVLLLLLIFPPWDRRPP